MSKNFYNYIGGKWTESAAKETFENRNPSDINEVIGIFPRSAKDDVDKAVFAATLASGEWNSIPAPQRGKILFEAGCIMASRKNELAKIISRENGKTVESAAGDVQSGIDMAYFAGGEGCRWYGKTSQSGLKKRFAMTKRAAIGVVGIIPSWNFPMAITCWKTFPALLCGNTIVLKSEENTPQTAVCFAEIMQEAGLPQGVLNLIHGVGSQTGDILVNHSGVDMISFTGSSQIGKLIGKNCSARLAKVSLELGGKNAVIVSDTANLDLAVDGIVKGAFSLSGQRCTATSRVIVYEKIYDIFLEKLIAKTRSQKIGPGSDASCDVTPLINKKQFQRVLAYIEGASKDGARVLVGGNPLKGGIYDKGYYIEPTLISNVNSKMKIVREEVFGPVLVISKVSSYQEAIETHNSSPYGLSASFFTNDINQAMSFFEDAQAGVCYINAPTFGSEPHLPFGGVKNSGLGYREAGWAAIEAFSEVKTLYIDYSSKIQNVQFEGEKNK